jgi:hypothetical protein
MFVIIEYKIKSCLNYVTLDGLMLSTEICNCKTEVLYIYRSRYRKIIFNT